MTNPMHTVILTPNAIVFDSLAESVTAPGINGDFTILAGHVPFLSILRAGSVKIRKSDGSDFMYSIKSGVCNVQANRVTFLIEHVN